ncbi:MAG: long-chain fatty acid--CoA ligase [Candidatus Omnitrophica bacterium]|nr:long-chain fatty acid--CoA ligase [Candidatus Omnitrophota bacterium]
MNRAKTLVDILRNSAQAYPEKTFVIFGSKRLSFREIERMSSSLAAYFIREGISKGDRIALWLQNVPEFVISYFGIVFCGATVVPINTLLKREEAKFIIGDSKAKFIICSNSRIEDCLNIILRVDNLKKIISFSFSPRAFYQVEDLYSIISQKINLPSVFVSPSDLAAILYTSGTTGKPKGACLRHSNLMANVKDCASLIKVRRKDRFLCILPLFHSFASTVCMLLPLYCGASMVLFRAVRPFKRILRSIIRNRISIFVGVPSLFNILKEIKLPWFLRGVIMKIFNPVRICISGAAALSPQTLREFEAKFKVPLLEGYGLTEASPVCSLNPLKKRKAGSIGLPLPSVEMRIDSPQEGIGELLVKGPNVMAGYLNKEEETKEVLKEGWLYTGDLARCDEEGYFYIVGRRKEMINVRGLNVYPREIEEILYLNPQIKEAAVVGINHPHRGEVPVAFVVLQPQADIKEREIINYLKRHLASYKIPFRVKIKDVLPKNATGKVLKENLKSELEGPGSS